MIGVFIIFLFLALILIVKEQRAFSLFTIYCFLDKGLSFSGPFQIKDVILLIFISLLFIKKKQYVCSNYPMIFCSILSAFSYLISTYLAQESHWPFTILKCVRYFLLPVCFYYFICKSRKELFFFIKALLGFSIFIVIYSFLELSIGTSPIVNFINDYNGSGYNMDETFRYGVKRIQAVFIHSTSLGYYCVSVIAFLLFFVNKNIRRVANLNNILYISTIVGLSIVVFLTGTRSAIVPLAAIYAYTFRKNIFQMKNFFLLVVCSIICYIIASAYLGSYFDSIITSVLNTNDNAVGSSSDMREKQFEIAFLYWSMAPIFGHGAGYTFDIVTPSNPDMYGAESIWMPLLIDNGILGCFAYLTCYWTSLKFLLKKVFSLSDIIFLMLLLLMNTTTSVPGFDVSFIFMLVFAVYSLGFINKGTKSCSVQ